MPTVLMSVFMRSLQIPHLNILSVLLHPYLPANVGSVSSTGEGKTTFFTGPNAFTLTGYFFMFALRTFIVLFDLFFNRIDTPSYLNTISRTKATCATDFLSFCHIQTPLFNQVLLNTIFIFFPPRARVYTL